MPHPAWTEFLNQADLPQGSASLSAADTHISSGTTLLMPLTEQTLISLEGTDAEKFLQGQLSCDLNLLSTERSLLGANCTHKGMVISVSRLFKRAQGSLLMRLPSAAAEPALANLQKFAVFSKISIASADEAWCGLGLIGESASELLSQIGITAPTTVNQQILSDNLILVKVPGETPRFELWCPQPQAQQLWTLLAAHAQPEAYQTWLAAEITAGLPQLGAESLDSYIPQMLNLQAVDGIGFSKGCYTGQEVIARLQFRGKLKKLMYSATLSLASLDGAEISPGASLYSSNGRSAGKLLCFVQQGSQLLLQAIISKTAADSSDLRLFSADGPPVSLLPLPYTIDPELFERPER